MNGDHLAASGGDCTGHELSGGVAPSGAGESKTRETAADRRARPSFYEIAQGAADKFGVCRRPIPMMVIDTVTWKTEYVAAPCKSTVESDCPACAARARLVRFQQCSEGWHAETEPVDPTPEPTDEQTDLLTQRADLVSDYRNAKKNGNEELAEILRDAVAGLDTELRATGIRQSLPPLDPKPKPAPKRSTKRRQDVPDLPRRKVAKTTVGHVYGGRWRPSMFVTLTMPSYGRINSGGAKDVNGKPCSDGSPVVPDGPKGYDYRRAARDTIHFPALFDRWVKNLRRVVGYDVQYFATVEPQRRGAPHIHIALRGAISHEIIRQVTAATYHQVWWPHFEEARYEFGHMPVWNFDDTVNTFVDPDTGERLLSFDEVRMQTTLPEPAHTIRFGAQVDSKGILGGTEEARRHIGYLTKYLTKSIGEVLEPQSQRAADHYNRLHEELKLVPCSPQCPVWLRYGIVPRKATHKTVPGRCKGKAHRRSTLGLRGRRVLVSRRWTGKTLPDHKADRAEFVRQVLAEAGIEKPDTRHCQVMPVQPGDPDAPPRDHLILDAIARRSVWANEWAHVTALRAERQAAQHDSAIAA